MPLFAEDMNTLTLPQKAELYKVLQEDEELKNFLALNEKMFEELAQRDKAYKEGKIKLTPRQQLTARLKNRRDAQ